MKFDLTEEEVDAIAAALKTAVELASIGIIGGGKDPTDDVCSSCEGTGLDREHPSQGGYFPSCRKCDGRGRTGDLRNRVAIAQRLREKFGEEPRPDWGRRKRTERGEVQLPCGSCPHCKRLLDEVPLSQE